MQPQLVDVLLIEDNHDDVFFLERVVKKAGLPWKLTVLMDGQKALEYTAQIAKSVVPVPALVFLDLKLPYASGFEVLASMRSVPTLEKVPIILLTSSPEQRDQQRGLELGANAYRIKPPTEEMLRSVAPRH